MRSGQQLETFFVFRGFMKMIAARSLEDLSHSALNSVVSSGSPQG